MAAKSRPRKPHSAWTLLWFLIGIVGYRSQFTIVISSTPTNLATSACFSPFSNLAFLIYSPKIVGSP